MTTEEIKPLRLFDSNLTNKLRYSYDRITVTKIFFKYLKLKIHSFERKSNTHILQCYKKFQ